MKRSIGFQTQQKILEPMIEIEDYDKYQIIRCESIPTFVGGNYIYTKSNILASQLDQWEKVFQSHFKKEITQHHLSLVQGPILEGDVNTDEFKKKNYETEICSILRAQNLKRPQSFREDLKIRAFESESDFEKLVENMNELPHLIPEKKKQRDEFQKEYFKKHQDYHFQRRGTWYGAFIGDELIGSCGIYVFDGIARYQEVVVKKSHQNQKVATTLVYQAAVLEKEKSKVDQWVIVADLKSYAEKMYLGLGFQITEKEFAVFRLFD